MKTIKISERKKIKRSNIIFMILGMINFIFVCGFMGIGAFFIALRNWGIFGSLILSHAFVGIIATIIIKSFFMSSHNKHRESNEKEFERRITGEENENT